MFIGQLISECGYKLIWKNCCIRLGVNLHIMIITENLLLLLRLKTIFHGVSKVIRVNMTVKLLVNYTSSVQWVLVWAGLHTFYDCHKIHGNFLGQIFVRMPKSTELFESPRNHLVCELLQRTPKFAKQWRFNISLYTTPLPLYTRDP